jgi:copper chaperone CopZ
MRKMINVTGLDCAHCAAEFESIVKGCEGIEDAKINFILEKIIVTAKDEASIEAALKKAKEKFPEAQIN